MDQNQHFLQLFWDLASVDPEKQTAAALALTKTLSLCQQRVGSSSSSGGDGDGEAPPVNPLLPQQKRRTPSRYCDELDYSLTRLIRGLASSRNGARHGFALALSEILSIFAFIPLESILARINEVHAGNAKSKGLETRNKWFAKIFGYLSILRSSRVEETLRKVEGTQSLFVQMLVELLAIQSKKSFLPELVFQLIIDVIRITPKKIFLADVLPLLLESLPYASAPKEWLPEMVPLWLAIEETFKLDASTYCLSLSQSTLLHSAHLSALIPVFLNAAYTSPRLHSLWTAVLTSVTSSSTSSKGVQDLFHLVLDGFFASTNEKKFMAFQVVEAALPLLSHEQLPFIFTPQFTRTLVQSLSSPKNLMHQAARHTLHAITATARKNSHTALATINALQGVHGTANFDRNTKTTTVGILLRSLSVTATEDYLQELFVQFRSAAGEVEVADVDEDAPPSKMSIVDARQLWVIEQLFSLTRGSILISKQSLILKVLDFLFVHSFYDVNDATTPKKKKRKEKKGKEPKRLRSLLHVLPQPISPKIRSLLVQRFFQTLSHLNSQQLVETEGSRKFLPYGVMADGQFWASLLFELQEELDAHPAFTVVESEAADDEEEAEFDVPALKKALRASIHRLQNDCTRLFKRLGAADNKVASSVSPVKSPHAALKQKSSLMLLLLHLGFMMPSKPQELAPTVTDMLIICDKLFPVEAEGKEDSEEETLLPIEVMTDVFMHLLVDPSHVVREIVQNAFRSFSSEITEGALDIILDVVFPPLEGEGSRRDGEKSNAKASDSGDNSSEDDGEEDDDEEESSSSSSSSFGDNPQNSSIDSDDEEESDGSLMDDEQMFAMDSAVESMLTNLKLARTSRSTSDTADLHFRFRALDLLAIFIKSQPSSPLVFYLLKPLLHGLTAGGDKKEISLMNKVKNTFLRISSIKDYARTDVDSEALNETIAHFFSVATLSKIPEAVSLCVDGSLFLMKVLMGQSEEELGELSLTSLKEAFSKTFTVFMTKRTKLTKPFFAKFLTRFPSIGWQLLPIVVENALKARNTYLKISAFELVQQLCQGKVSAELSTVFLSLRTPVATLALSLSETPLKAKQLRALVQCMVNVAKTSNRLDSSSTKKALSSLLPYVETILSSPQYVTAKALLNQSRTLQALIAGTPLTKPNTTDSSKKRKLERTDSGENESTPSKRPRTSSLSKKKEAKEAVAATKRSRSDSDRDEKKAKRRKKSKK